MTRITITATETIVYEKTYELEELEEYTGITLAGDCEGDLDVFTTAIYNQAHGYGDDAAGFAEDLERHGDVQGQDWKGTIAS